MPNGTYGGCERSVNMKVGDNPMTSVYLLLDSNKLLVFLVLQEVKAGHYGIRLLNPY